MNDPDNCPEGCDHVTFHYCDSSGTHCDKHCVCRCHQCEAARKKPPAPDPETGGAILPGSTIVGR